MMGDDDDSGVKINLPTLDDDEGDEEHDIDSDPITTDPKWTINVPTTTDAIDWSPITINKPSHRSYENKILDVIDRVISQQDNRPSGSIFIEDVYRRHSGESGSLSFRTDAPIWFEFMDALDEVQKGVILKQFDTVEVELWKKVGFLASQDHQDKVYLSLYIDHDDIPSSDVFFTTDTTKHLVVSQTLKRHIIKTVM